MTSTALNRTFKFRLATLALLATTGQTPFTPAFSAGFQLEPPVLRVAAETEPPSLDWNREPPSSASHFILSFLMRGLMQTSAQGNPVCDLCQSVQVSPDGKTLTFALLPDVEWSDGQKLEAQHFVDSFRRLLNPAYRLSGAGPFRVIAGAPQASGGPPWDPKKLGVVAETKTQLKITLIEPRPGFLHLLTTTAVYPIRKELLKEPGAKETAETHATTAVLGPYQLAAWERGKRIVIEGNPKFTGQRPVYRVDFVLGTHAQQLDRFKKGKLDILTGATMEDALQLPGQKVRVDPYWATRLLLINAKRYPLSEAALRRALLLAMNRDTLPGLLKNGERRATGLIPPGLPGHRELPLVTPDLNRALSERKSVLGESQSPIELRLLILESSPEQRAIASWLTPQLERVQLRLRVEARKEGVFRKMLETGDFDLAVETLTYTIADPVGALQVFHSTSPATTNPGRWANVAFDQLLTELNRETRPQENLRLLDRATQMLETQETVLIPLGYPSSPFLLGRRVGNFAITPFGEPDLVRIQFK